MIAPIQNSRKRGLSAVASRTVVFADRVGPATVWIDDGKIARIEEDQIAGTAEDWGGDYMLPGLIELHTDHLEPHFVPRPKVYWDPEAAVFSYDAQIAASGITTVFDSLRAGGDLGRTNLNTGLFPLQDALVAAYEAGHLRVDHLTHLRCEICAENTLEEAAAFVARHPVHLMSLMDHTPGVRQFRDESKLREYYRGKSNSTDAELDEFFAIRRDLHERNHDRHRKALIALANANGIVLASHDDTTPEHVAESAECGVRLAEFPTTREAAQACVDAGIAVMMGAPNVVRGGSHSGNIAATDLAASGLLNVLSSDYVPASLLQAAFLLRDMPAIGGLSGAIRLVTKAPAEALGLYDRGEIAVGRRADLVRATLPGRVPVVREVLRTGVRVA